MAKTTSRHGVAVAFASVMLASAALAQAPGDLADLVGVRGSAAESQMLARGWKVATSSTGADSKYLNWWNPATRRCVTVMVDDGRYQAITPTLPADCNHTAQGNRPLPSHEMTRPEYLPLPYPPPQSQQPNYAPNYPSYNQPVWSQSASLNLICFGGGSKPGGPRNGGYVWNDRQNRYVPVYLPSNQQFGSDVQVDIFQGRGRIHLSGPLKPAINNGGLGGGWWELRNLRINRDTVTASYRLNGMNQPKVRIDRRTGEIRIDGIERYRGSCDAGYWGGGRRRF